MTTRSGVQLKAQRPAGPEATFVEHPDEVAEASWVAGQIEELIAAGAPAREIAILYRVNAQSEAYEQALADLGVPYVVRGAERFFDRAEVREAAMLMRAAVRSADAGSADAPDAVAATTAVLAAAGWSARPPSGIGATRERWESLAAVVALAEEVVAVEPAAQLPDVLSEFDELPVCVRYRLPDGSETDDFPAHQSDFHHCAPVFETLAGWREELTGPSLPGAAASYVSFVGGALDVPVRIVGTGA